MQLTIFSANSDATYFLEVDKSMTVEDLLALVEAESSLPANSFILHYNSAPLSDKQKSLEAYGLQGNEEILELRNNAPRASSSASGQAGRNAFASGSGGGGAGAGVANDLERMRLQVLGDPGMMARLRQYQPDLADAITTSPQRFAEIMQRMGAAGGMGMGGGGGGGGMSEMEREKQRQIALLNEDPYNVDAQRKIEEIIRQEAVMENMEHAMEYSPESFGNVHMLYIDVEVNGHKVKAFVDSGAQSTIISPDCAEKCNIMRLLDTRFGGMARGVGTAKILGRIHSAQIKLGNLHLPVAFSVLEGRDVDLLFGLDMLKRYQACIDLGKNALLIQGQVVPFLAEHELPNKARQMEELAEELDQASAAGKGPVAPTEPGQAVAGGSEAGQGAKPSFPGAGQTLGGGGGGPGPSSSTGGAAPPPSAGGVGNQKFPEESIQAIMNLGVSREHAISTLEAAGGNVDVAASLLF